MKKFFRNLLSGNIVFITLLLLEVGVFLYLQFGMDDLVTKIFGVDENAENWQLVVIAIYLLFRIVAFIVSVIIFFKIINKDEDPEFKIPWIVRNRLESGQTISGSNQIPNFIPSLFTSETRYRRPPGSFTSFTTQSPKAR